MTIRQVVKTVLAVLLLPLLALARPAPFSDGKCSVTFPLAYRSQPGRVSAQQGGRRYTLTIAPLKILDPAQHLANVRRQQLAQHAAVQLLKVDGRHGLEIRRQHSLSRLFVFGQTAYQAQVTYQEKQPGSQALAFVRSLRFLAHAATPYTAQRMSRYDAQLKDVPVQKCAENLLKISSLLTGFKIKHKRYPSALKSLQQPITRAYGYQRQGGHYLLYCTGHHHRGLPPHYPRTDDALHTMLSPTKAYTPGY